MRKGFMKKLLATLAVALTATVGAGVALIESTTDVSAAGTGETISTDFSSGLPSGLAIHANTTDAGLASVSNGALSVDTGANDGYILLTTTGTYDNFVMEYDVTYTSAGWLGLFMYNTEAGMYAENFLFVQDNALQVFSGGVVETITMSVNPTVAGTTSHVKVTAASGTVTVAITVGDTTSTHTLATSGFAKTGTCLGIPSTTNTVTTIDNVSIINTDTTDTTVDNPGNFTTSVTPTWSGTTASYSSFSSGNYVVTDAAYSFTSDEVLVFETTFVTNSVMSTSNTDIGVYNFAFLYGEDSATTLVANPLGGHSVIGQSYMASSQQGNYYRVLTSAETPWLGILPDATLTFYIHSDGSASIYVNGALEAYISGATVEANLTASSVESTKASDRDGVLGWAFFGTGTMNFSYSSLKVGKTAAFDYKTGTPGGVTWLAEHTQTTTDCVDANTDHVCDDCGETVGTHVEASGSHSCAYCGQVVSTSCTDSNTDHACDICGASMGTHTAADGTHTCDYCGQRVTDCADSDGDNLCDVCGTDMGSVSTTPGLLQGFETVKIATGVVGVTSVATSTEHVTEGSYSNALTTNAQWFELHITLDSVDLTGYNAVAFDFYAANGTLSLLSYGNAEHTEYAGQSGTWILDAATFNSLLSGMTFTVVCMSNQSSNVIYFDNFRGTTIENSGSGDGGSTGGDTTVETTGVTTYTQFDSSTLDSNWTMSNTSTMAISNGALSFTTGSSDDGNSVLLSTGTYQNFILEYDMTITSKGSTSWIPLVMFGASSSSYISNPFLYINQWGAIAAMNFNMTAFVPGVTPFVDGQTSGFSAPLHVKVVAQDGTVTLYLSLNGQTAEHVIGTGLSTAGQIGIPAGISSTFSIDNLVLINSDEYADYTVTQITFANSSIQANAGESLTGNLLTSLTESATAQGIDMTNKSVTFRSKTDGFFINSSTGEWEYTASTVNGAYLLEYVITVNDLVLDGWVYPLGDNGVYTIEGNIAVDVMGGTNPEEGEGGGSGDTSDLPEVVGDTNIATHIKGKIQDVSFVVDTKTFSIISITLANENVKSAAYTLTDGDTGITITFKGDFMALLETGDNEFIIATAKGTTSVIVRVSELKAPVLSSETSVTMRDNAETDAAFTIDTDSLEIISVYRIGATKQLNSDAYTYADGTLTIKKEYLATLSADTYTFTVTTEGGSVEVTVTIEAVYEPILLGSETANFTFGITGDVEFELETFGEEITQILRTGASKALGSNAYAMDTNACILTFNQAYIETLSVGANEFTVSTIGGDVTVTINVIAATAPTCAENSKTATFGDNTDVTFTVNVYGQSIIAIQRTGADYGLGSDAYTYANNTLTVVGSYVALLPVGENEFTLETLGGTVKLYVVVDGSELSAPTVTLNGNKATWEAVDGATGYTYKINEDGAETTVDAVTEITLTHNQVLYVKANGNGSTSKDSDWATSEVYTAPKLTAPAVTLDGNTATWTAIDGATGYAYKIDDGDEITTNELSVALSHNQAIVVKAVGDNATCLDSAWSTEVTYVATTLVMSEITLEANEARWTAVDGAVEYAYKINGGTEQTTNGLSVALKHNEYIEVKAVGNGTTTLDSSWVMSETYIAPQLATPVVELSGNVATWEALDGVTYKYTVNGGDEQTATTNSVTIYHNETIIVWAVGNGETSLDSEKSAAVTYTADRLATPVVELNGNVATWEALDGVTYKYTVNGGEAQIAESNSVTLIHNQKLVVWAVGDNKTSLDSLESNEVTYTATTLTAPVITLEKNVATWEAVDGAVSYTYKINGGEEITTNERSVKLVHNDYIEVRANGNDETTLTSGWSDAETYTATTLTTPVISLNGNVATWTVEDGAAKYVYKLSLNGEEQDATGNSVELKHGETIYVMAIGNGETSLSSGWSTPARYTAPTLDTPNVVLTDNVASWKAIDGAVKYAYKINGGTEQTTSALSVTLENGQKIQVKAVGNGETSLDSAWSTAIAYYGDALDMPVISLDGNVASWTAIENATKYVYKIGEYGVETETDELSVTLIHNQKVYVKAIGNGTTILDSEWSVSETYVAPTLTKPEVVLNGNEASWTAEDGVSYVYKIGLFGEEQDATDNTVTLKHGETIYVMAVGNGETSLSSAWSDAVTYTATTLATPEVSLDGNKVVWNAVNGAIQYVYKVNGGAEQTTSELSVELKHNQYIIVKAVGNGETTLDSGWATSETYEAPALATPEVSLIGNEASWAAVDGAVEYAYMINGVQSTTGELSVKLTHGQTIVVKAVGDGETHLDGSFSVSVTYTATTLEKPVVSLDGNVASWTVEDGVSYVYKIGVNGEEKEATDNSVSLKHNETVYVKAVGNGETTLDSGWSDGVKYTATTLATPVVSLDGNVASWTAVDGAVEYVYTVNGGDEQTTSELSVTLKHNDIIVVKAVGNGETTLDGAFSTPVMYVATTLEKPVVSLDGNVASWTAQDGVSYVYKIGVSGEAQDATDNTVTLKHSETLYVKAIGNGETTLDSGWSDAVTYTATTLAQPEVSLDDNVASWTAVDGAVEYVYKINGGDEQTTSELSVSLKHNETIEVKAVGNGETTLDSSWSDGVKYTATTLATPVVSLDGNVASWAAVANATAYVYKINGGDEQTTSELSVTLEDGQTIIVKAVGNGETLLDSSFSVSVTYTEQTDKPGQPGEGDDGEVEGGDIIDGGETDNPFEEDYVPEAPDETPDEQPDETPDDGEGDDGESNGAYEEEFTGSVKPNEDSYDTYMEGLANGGQVAGGCNGSVSMMAGLPIVGIIALFIRKKKEN